MNNLHRKILSVGFGCFISAASYGTIPHWIFGSTFGGGPFPPSASQRATGQKFTPKEDARLCALVDQYGTKNWKQIASHMFNRSARQCRDRWKIYLAPGLNLSTWTDVEDALLREKFNELGPKWVQIVKFFPGRTDTNCKNRWQQLQTREQRRLQLNPPAPPPSAPLPQDDSNFRDDSFGQYGPVFYDPDDPFGNSFF
ncbi:MAG: hypothetical protein LBF34_04415 [Puniceicoccales bacterium]|nr:hypothetical protein [Puniceicoccales bacterium]